MKLSDKIKIAVALHGNQFRAVQAQLVHDLGPTPVALHRSINHSGWSLTSVHCGFVICRGTTKAKAVAHYQHILAHRSPEEVLARIQLRAPAPCPDSLAEAHLGKPRSSAQQQPSSAVAVAAAIAERAALTTDEHQAVVRALCKAGPNAGRLLAKAPTGYRDPLGQAAWNGLQPNPYKVQTSSILFAGPTEKALLDKLHGKNWPVWLDSDADALVKLGVW
jgi:hypothetical protein